MSVRNQNWKPERGEKDAKRHRDLIKKEVKEKAFKELVNTPVAGKRGKIKVKIRGKKSYYFKHGSSGEGYGIGQGEGNPGDVIGRRPGEGDEGEGHAGDMPGEDEFETEIDIEELFEWLCEELGLPKLKKKEGNEIEVKRGWKPSGVKKTGIPPRLRKKLTVKQAIKRNSGTILGLKQILKKKLGKDPKLDDSYYVWALYKAKLNKNKAIEYLEKIINQEIEVTKEEIKKAAIYLTNDDLRYKKLEEDIQYESNAVLIAILDVSGSMSDEKKFIARSFYWWSFKFLQTIYQNVKIVFITHHTEAKVVSEEQFFHTVESGGTRCASAYRLAKELIETQFPPERWNSYVIHFSDGEDFAPDEAVKAIKDLLPITNAVIYGEVKNAFDSLLERMVNQLGMRKTDDNVYLLDSKAEYLIATRLEEPKDIWKAIKIFFKKEGVE